ncbi:MAG: RDD family protein [bacterium]
MSVAECGSAAKLDSVQCKMETMRYWYYHESGQQKGPIAESDFVKLFESGSLSASTFVWTKGLKEWREASTIENLVPPAFTPPAIPVHVVEALFADRDFVPCGPQARPWVRYWARIIDVMLFAFLVGTVLGSVYPSALEINDTLLGIVVVFAYVFVEPCMLSSWGTTPGKAILDVRLRKQNGTKPGYSDALSRAFNVWIRGFGLGIPIIALFTLISAYMRLSENGLTSWDKDGGFRIIHKVVGAGRVLAVIAILVGFVS